MRTVGRGVTLGLGVRVLRGDATGYAYTEELAEERMREAARTAAQIAASGAAPGPIAVRAGARWPIATRSREPSLARPGADKLALLRRADAAARAFDPRIVRVEASLAEEWREVLVVTSDGHLARDSQPMIRFGVSAVAEEDGKRAGRALGRRRAASAWSTSRARARAPRSTAARRRARRSPCSTPSRRRPARWRSCWAPGDSGILLHEAVGHGLEADFNRKETSNYSDQSASRSRRALCTVVDDGTIDNARGSINVDDEGNAGQRNVLIENGMLRRLHAGPPVARSTSASTPSGNGRRQSFRHEPLPRMTNTFLLAGQDDPEDIIKSVKRGVYAKRFSRRPGQHLERRLRLLADRELPDRGRQADRAAQGREPDRQRPRRAAQGDDAGQRLRAVATAPGPAARTGSRCRSASARRR